VQVPDYPERMGPTLIQRRTLLSGPSQEFKRFRTARINEFGHDPTGSGGDAALVP